jgi:transcriptional regulator with XRE-family HTH domain
MSAAIMQRTNRESPAMSCRIFAASARINQYERGKHTPDVGTAARLARVLAVPAPFLHAQDNALAARILAFDEVRPSVRRSIIRKVTDQRSA